MSKLFRQLHPRLILLLALGLSLGILDQSWAQQKSSVPGTTVNLLSFDGLSGKINFNLPALTKILEKARDLEIIMYSINGSSRTGKSYLLNFMNLFLSHEVSQNGSPDTTDWFTTDTGSLNSFKWRSGSVPETKGIQIWSEPFIVTRRGQKVAVLLMDCQGLFDKETTNQENAIIISLSTILSSVSIFNLKNKMDESLLADILFYSEYSRALSRDRKERNQKLLFLIRDFDFGSEFCYGYHDNQVAPTTGPRCNNKNKNNGPAGNYYKNIFHDDDIRDENRGVRTQIEKAFEHMSIFLMPDPGEEFRADSKNSLPNADFQKYLKQFIHLINSNEYAVTKKIQHLSHTGEAVTGQILLEQVAMMATIFTHTHHLPKVNPYTEMYIQIQNERQISEVMDWVKREWDEWEQDHPKGTSDFEVNQFKGQVQLEVDIRFNDLIMMGDRGIQEKYKKIVRKQCDDFCHDRIQKNKYNRENAYYGSVREYHNKEILKHAATLVAGGVAVAVLGPLAAVPTLAINSLLYWYAGEKPDRHWQEPEPKTLDPAEAKLVIPSWGFFAMFIIVLIVVLKCR